MYPVFPRSKPLTSSMFRSSGCQATSGYTRFGKNFDTSSAICVTGWPSPNSSRLIAYTFWRHCISSGKPTVGGHSAAARVADVPLDRALHELEDVREPLRALEEDGVIHRVNHVRPALQGL